jgi:hypothetical protein
MRHVDMRLRCALSHLSGGRRVTVPLRQQARSYASHEAGGRSLVRTLRRLMAPI